MTEGSRENISWINLSDLYKEARKLVLQLGKLFVEKEGVRHH